MDEFKKKFMEQLAKYFDADRYSLQEMEVIKNNDRKLHGICIAEHDSAYGVNVYVEEVYPIYQALLQEQEDIDPWDVILYGLVEQIEHKRMEGKKMLPSGVIEKLLHYDAIQDRLIFRLINAEKNRKYLENKVYIPVMDLALCLCVLVNEPEKDNEVGSTVISEDIAVLWGVPLKRIFETAKRNTVRIFPPKILRMSDILEELEEKDRFSLFMNPPIYEPLNEPLYEAQDCYVLTNCMGVNGASVLCYDSVLKDFSDTQGGKNFYILPCSIHETMLLPSPEFHSHVAGELLDIVQEVNQTSVPPDEILADGVYYYNRADDEMLVYGQSKAFAYSSEKGWSKDFVS